MLAIAPSATPLAPFKSTRESRPCACGGRVQAIPDVVRRHGETKKHTTYEFGRLSMELLTLTDLADKKKVLIQLRSLLRTGRVV